MGLGVLAALSLWYGGFFVDEESLVGTLWQGYLDLVDVALDRSGLTIQRKPSGTFFAFVQSAELALIVFLPQLAVALSGGLAASLLARLTQRFRRRSDQRDGSCPTVGRPIKRPRFSIWMLMAIVGVVALNLAVGRALWDDESDFSVLLACIGFNAIVTQLAVFFLIRSRNGARAFWIGFVASSVVAALSCSCAFPTDSESLNAAFWFEYLDLAQEFTGIVIFQTGFAIHYSATPIPLSPFEPLFDFIEAAKIGLVFYAPQFILAMSGGALTFFLARLTQVIHRRVALRTAPA